MSENVLDGSRRFKCGEDWLDQTVEDFWAWAMSRLLADGPRGDLAEFIVSCALGADLKVPKRGWGEYDISYRGRGVEVKCSSYLQAWERERPSAPGFGIPKTYASDVVWNGSSYAYRPRPLDDEPRRRSDVYVFCLFAERDRDRADPADLGQWRFYILPTSVIDKELGEQRRVSIPTLERLGAEQCGFIGIKAAVDRVFDGMDRERAAVEGSGRNDRPE